MGNDISRKILQKSISYGSNCFCSRIVNWHYRLFNLSILILLFTSCGIQKKRIKYEEYSKIKDSIELTKIVNSIEEKYSITTDNSIITITEFAPKIDFQDPNEIQQIKKIVKIEKKVQIEDENIITQVDSTVLKSIKEEEKIIAKEEKIKKNKLPLVVRWLILTLLIFIIWVALKKRG